MIKHFLLSGTERAPPNSTSTTVMCVCALIWIGLAGLAGRSAYSAEQNPSYPMQTGHADAPIILNGGFESGKLPWWGAGRVVHNSAAAGQAALQLNSGFIAQDKRRIQPGTRYRISMQIRSDAAPAGSVFVQLSYRGVGVNPGWYGPIRVKLTGHEESALFVTGGSHGWQQFSAIVQTPVGADQILLYLRKLDGSAGTAYYDAVEISPTHEPVTPTINPQIAKTALRTSPVVQPAMEPALAAAAASVAQAAAARLGSVASLHPHLLAQHGRARFRIHVERHADNLTLHAAAELADYLKRISGADFLPLSNDDNTQSGPLLIVGRESQLAKQLGKEISFDALGDDGFVIRSIGEHIVIAGATPRGTMYGVNWFLDRKLGVKWLSPDFTVVPRAPVLQFDRFHIRQIPRFSYREVLSHEGEDKVYRAHNLLNGESHGPSFLPSPPGIDSWNHAWMTKGSYVSFFELLPKAKYARAHPEWYAGGQLAMMNPQMREAMAAAIVDRLKVLPDYRDVWFSIKDQDWGWDMDVASRAFADKHGAKPSAPRLDMMIDVANQVRKVLPEARFAFNAYHWSFSPPSGMTVPDHILVFPMTIQVDYSTPLNEGRNVQLGKDIVGWNSIADHVLIWDHITNFSGYYQPTPNIFPIGRSIQWLATLPHVQGYFAEGSWGTPNAEFASLRAWMIARLLWNPDENIASLVTEFCQHYYGPAAPAMRRYIDLMHAAIRKSGDVLAEKTQVDIAMYDLDFVVAADALFDEAEAAVIEDPVLLNHVMAARLPVDYVVLLRRTEYTAEAARRKLGWQVGYGKRLTRFEQGANMIKLRQYRQGGNAKELAELLRVDRHTPASSAWIEGLGGKAQRVYQDLSFNRYESARIVQDNAASDGAAIRMKGQSSVWAIHFKLDKLPTSGAWHLYADIRVNAETGHEGVEAVHVGAYPPMNLFNKGLVGDLNDGRYHLIKVPGGPFRFSTDHQKGIYIQSSNNKFVKEIYLDRFVAVKADPAP